MINIPDGESALAVQAKIVPDEEREPWRSVKEANLFRPGSEEPVEHMSRLYIFFQKLKPSDYTVGVMNGIKMALDILRVENSFILVDINANEEEEVVEEKPKKSRKKKANK